MDLIEIGVLQLPASVTETLIAAGLDELEKLTDYLVEQPLESIPGIGPASAAAIKAAMDQFAANAADAPASDAAAASDDVAADAAAAAAAAESDVEPVGAPSFAGDVAAASQSTFAEPAGAGGVKFKIVARRPFRRALGEFDIGDKVGVGVLRDGCPGNFMVDSLCGSPPVAYAVENMESPGHWQIRIRDQMKVGEVKFPAGHAIADLMVPHATLDDINTIVSMIRSRILKLEIETK